MNRNEIFMTYDSPETEKVERTQETVLTCKQCKSDRFRLVCTPGNFPMMHCWDCKIEIGRVGWIPKKWGEVVNEDERDLGKD
jgi:hypothetical protein